MHLLAWPCNKPFPVPNSNVSVLFDLTVHQAYEQVPEHVYMKQPQEYNASDFPGGPVVQNLPCNAGDASSNPGWGTKIPHAAITEPMCSKAHVPQPELGCYN